MDDLDCTRQLQPRRGYWIAVRSWLQPHLQLRLERLRNVLVPAHLSVLLIHSAILGTSPGWFHYPRLLLHQHEVDLLSSS